MFGGFLPHPQHNVQTNANRRKTTMNNDKKKHVHISDNTPQRHTYDFNWECAIDYWYTKSELKTFNEDRFDDADILRKERGIHTSSRDDADVLSHSRRNIFIDDTVTHALEDEGEEHLHDGNDGNGISIVGIEHFVFPVLQKEMLSRKKELKIAVLTKYRDPLARKKDPQGIALANECAKYSSWARNVAKERGIKYCQMKRSGGDELTHTVGHGGLLMLAHNTVKGQRHLDKQLAESGKVVDMKHLFSFVNNIEVSEAAARAAAEAAAEEEDDDGAREFAEFLKT
jgi:hypothetical protein